MRVWFLSNFFGGGSFLLLYLCHSKGHWGITGNGVRATWFRFVLSFPILFYSVPGRWFFLYWWHNSHDGNALLGGGGGFIGDVSICAHC